MWSALIISISAGIIITIIVDTRATDAHNEVLHSQEKIKNILHQLDITDQKHNEVLTQLEQSKTRNENLAKKTILSSLNYIKSMLDNLTASIQKQIPEKNEIDFVVGVMHHLESPLNLVEQAIPQSSMEFKIYDSDITSVVLILRKLIIASSVTPASRTDELFELLKMSNQKLDTLLEQINQK